MKHSATGFTSKDARRPSNELKVKLHLNMNAKRNRVYPEVEVSDEVRIFRKRKPNEKERVGNFSQNVYTMEKLMNKWVKNIIMLKAMMGLICVLSYLRFSFSCVFEVVGVFTT